MPEPVDFTRDVVGFMDAYFRHIRGCGVAPTFPSDWPFWFLHWCIHPVLIIAQALNSPGLPPTLLLYIPRV